MQDNTKLKTTDWLKYVQTPFDIFILSLRLYNIVFVKKSLEHAIAVYLQNSWQKENSSDRSQANYLFVIARLSNTNATYERLIIFERCDKTLLDKIKKNANDADLALEVEKNIGRRQPLINDFERAFPKATTGVNKVQGAENFH